MCVISFACAEESFERVVAWDDETGEVDKELSGNIEEDKKEVDGSDAEESIHFRDRCLLLKIVERRIFRELRKLISASPTL